MRDLIVKILSCRCSPCTEKCLGFVQNYIEDGPGVLFIGSCREAAQADVWPARCFFARRHPEECGLACNCAKRRCLRGRDWRAGGLRPCNRLRVSARTTALLARSPVLLLCRSGTALRVGILTVLRAATKRKLRLHSGFSMDYARAGTREAWQTFAPGLCSGSRGPIARQNRPHGLLLLKQVAQRSQRDLQRNWRFASARLELKLIAQG